MKPEEQLAELARENGTEFVELIKKYMLETSDPIKVKPQWLFHATKMGNLSSITEKGIIPHDVYGNSYFCTTQKHCLKFVQKPCIILGISTAQLDTEKMFLSKDHNKRIYKFDCYTYFDVVPPTAIKNWRVYK